MTLTQTAILTKHILTLTIMTIVLAILSYTGYQIWHSYYIAHLPIVEEKPDTKFGPLPSLDFPRSSVSSSNFNYSIDTSTGNLPKIGIDPGFEKNIKVYFVINPVATLLSSEKSQALAEKFGITTSPEILNDTNYRFSNQGKNLNVNLDSGNFAYTKIATTSAKQQFDDDTKLVSDFQHTLLTLGVFKQDLTGRNKVVYLKNDNGNFTPTALKSNADAAQISLWPQSLDGKPIYTIDYNKSLVNAVVTQSANNIENYLSLNFTYFPVDTTFATYPLKTSDAAFEDLRSGKGVVVITPNKPQVSITSTSLGYYMPEIYSPYLQPIFVFEGPNFAAYVPALREQIPLPTR